jgi:hypothetical protein
MTINIYNILIKIFEWCFVVIVWEMIKFVVKRKGEKQ